MTSTMMNGDYDGMMNAGHGWMVIWMFIGLLLVLAVLAVATFAIVRFSRPRRDTGDESVQILRRRYAAGEIDREEYEARRSDLGQ